MCDSDLISKVYPSSLVKTVIAQKVEVKQVPVDNIKISSLACEIKKDEERILSRLNSLACLVDNINNKHSLLENKINLHSNETANIALAVSSRALEASARAGVLEDKANKIEQKLDEINSASKQKRNSTLKTKKSSEFPSSDYSIKLGTTVTVNDTFDGYTLRQVVRALVTKNILD